MSTRKIQNGHDLEEKIANVVPDLRVHARRFRQTQDSADYIVQLTLQAAIDQVEEQPTDRMFASGYSAS